MENAICPACQGRQISTVDRVSTSDLIWLYAQVGLDVAPYFKGIPEIELNKCKICDLGFFTPACAGDDLFYEQLQQFDWYYQDDKPEYAHARDLVGSSDAVLEVGCGKGAFRSWLPAEVQYTGLEFNDEAIRKARSAGLDVIRQPIEEHAGKERGKYDVVCCFQVLEHIPQPRGFVHACVEALKPGGKLIIAVPAEDSFLSMAVDAHLNMPPHHALRWSDRALKNLALREGLDVVELWHEPVASFHEDWRKDILALHYFAQIGLSKHKLIDRSLIRRLLGRLLENSAIRDFFAARASKKLTRAHGHTVVLVASKPVLVLDEVPDTKEPDLQVADCLVS